jgi:hypothetical protein
VTVPALYENAPWERLGPAAIWIGLAGLALSVAMRRAVARSGERSFGVEHVAPLRTLSGALITVGLPFAVLWQRAHDTYPQVFGRVVAVVGIVFGVQALAIGAALYRDPRWRWALSYGLLTAATAAAVAVAAFSHTIIAEGQVTAMVAAIGFLLSGVAASLVAGVLAGRLENAPVRRACTGATLVGLAALVTWQLPVVQFVEGAQTGTVRPIYGSVYAFLAGAAAGALVNERRHRVSASVIIVANVTAVLVGYRLQSWFGLAVAALGIGVALTLRSSSRVAA